MASIISAGTTSGTAINVSGDTSGQLQLQTNGSTTAVTINTSQTTTFNAATSNPPLIAQINGTEQARIDASGNLLIGTTSSPSGSGSLSATGFVKGGLVSQFSGYENGNYTITTPGTVYSFNKDQGGGGGSSSTVFNITGLPNTDGSWALIYVRSSNTVGGVNCTAQVQINGTQVFTGGVQNTTKTAVFAVFRANGVWNAGAWATGASLNNVW